jgi:DnaJ-domain-containing protein 1
MGFFDRIETIIKSYLHDEDDHVFGHSAGKRRSSFQDPDIEAAFEELNDYLSSGSGGKKTASQTGTHRGGYARYDHAAAGGNHNQAGKTAGIPNALDKDFAELGLSPGASAEECKAAYKQLLKRHHPDRHAGHPGNMKKATEKSARLNAAYDRIERWRTTGKVE